MTSIKQNANKVFEVQGALNFDTVPPLMVQAEKLFDGAADICVDFSSVDECNSAGLGLMLEMIRFMQSRDKSIRFESIPEQIQIVAKAYGVDEELKAQGFM